MFFFQGRKPPIPQLQGTKIIISQISIVIDGCIQFLCVGLYESPDVLRYRYCSEGVPVIVGGISENLYSRR